MTLIGVIQRSQFPRVGGGGRNMCTVGLAGQKFSTWLQKLSSNYISFGNHSQIFQDCQVQVSCASFFSSSLLHGGERVCLFAMLHSLDYKISKTV